MKLFRQNFLTYVIENMDMAWNKFRSLGISLQPMRFLVFCPDASFLVVRERGHFFAEPPFSFLWYYVGMNIFYIEGLREKIAEIAKKRNLKLVVLFGSQATGKTHAKSDIDIAVIGRNSIDFDVKLKLMADFSDALGREDVEVVDLGVASPTLMYAVVRDGRIIFEETRGDFLHWKFYAIKIWLETAWLRVLRDRQLSEWAEKA